MTLQRHRLVFHEPYSNSIKGMCGLVSRGKRFCSHESCNFLKRVIQITSYQDVALVRMIERLVKSRSLVELRSLLNVWLNQEGWLNSMRN